MWKIGTKAGSIFLLLLLLAPGCGLRTVQPPRGSEPAAARLAPLLAQAREAMWQGRHRQADLLLERAIRLEPRDPLAWHLMARNHYQQGRYSQAIQFGLKANSLLPASHALAGENWRLLEQAYLKSGDREKAAAAHRHLALP